MDEPRKLTGGIGGARCLVVWALVLASVLTHALASTPPIRLYRPAEGVGASQDATGSLVALHDDTALVVSQAANLAPGTMTGALAFHRRVGGIWQREAILVPANLDSGSSNPHYAIALEQDLAVVAVAKSPSLPAVHTYARSGANWTEVDQFVLQSGLLAAIALSGDTLVVDNQVYLRAGAGWQLQATLQLEPGESVLSIAIDGDRVAAGTLTHPFPFANESHAAFYSRDAGTWTREGRIDTGSDLVAVAVSGETALVGAANAATAYVRDAGTWSEQGELDPLAALSGFGYSVALQGDRAVVGSPADTVFGLANAGTAYVFERSGSVWQRVDHVADLGVDYLAEAFGTSIALSGDSFLVGAPGDCTESGYMAGAGHLFELQGTSWTESATLDLGNSHSHDASGSAVAASAQWVAAGAPTAPTGTGAFDAGAVDMYEHAGAEWSWRTRIWPQDDYSGQGFGSALSLSGSTLAIGGANRVAVHEVGDGSWPFEAAFVPADTADNHDFGHALALDGDLLAIGDPGRLSSGATNPYGTVALFGRVGTSWSANGEMSAIDHAPGDSFGYALALQGSTLVVGAPQADIGIESDAGAVYVYVYNGFLFELQAKIVAPLPSAGTQFGASVALAGDVLAVGAGRYAPFVGGPYGAAYVFRRDTGVWTFEAVLDAPHTPASSFGASVALSSTGALALVGAPSTDQEPGSAFAFANDGTDWLPVSTWQSPSLAHGDAFGFAVAFAGDAGVISAPNYEKSGSVFLAPLGDAIFAYGFEQAP